MEDLLTISSTKRISRSDVEEHISLAQRTASLQVAEPTAVTTIEPKSSTDVLNALQDKPSYENLKACLRWLATPREKFNIKVPGPYASQIISALVNETIPNYWGLLNEVEHAKERNLLIKSLTSVAGLGALCLRLRTVLSNGKPESLVKISKVDNTRQARDCLEVIQQILKGRSTLQGIWQDIQEHIEKPIQRHLQWKELVGLLASNRILSIANEALIYCELSHADGRELEWIGDGGLYAGWLGAHVRCLSSSKDEPDRRKAGATILGRAFFLGYTDQLVESAFSGLLGGKPDSITGEISLFSSLAVFERINVLSAFLRLFSRRIASTSKDSYNRLIGGMSALLEALAQENAKLQKFLVEWLGVISGQCIGAHLSVRRAVIASLSNLDSQQEHALKNLMTEFADKLFIQSTPVLQQETLTQNLLLLIGRVYRADKSQIQSLAKSSVYINGVSNRLAASSQQSQVLGMVVGMAVSELVDPPDKRMKFTSETLGEEDVNFYMNLVGVQDKIGSIEDLRFTGADKETQLLGKEPKKPPKPKELPTISKIVAIEEVSESEVSDDDLPVYAKPDSDQEDEEEDATVVQRNKPTAPVYIRDLIAGLRDTQNYERYRLSISSAANLIRRKTSFGTEVKDHIEDLASLLCGLKDEYDMDKFQDMRLQAMIAVIVAEPLKMAQWFSNLLFAGDYSVSQRASMLTALTMAARELAGYREEDAELTGAYLANDALFPSKKLPDKYEKLYRLSAAPVDAATKQLQRSMVQPLATEAADQLAGPKVLKVRTFSSRMEVEKKRKKPITNQLAKLVADGFFYPLTGRWRAQSRTHGLNSVFATPFLQAHFLQTLSLILTASGSSTLSLPALTVEFWGLLLSVRTAASSAKPVLEALLFGFLTILDINGNDARRLATDHATELLETQAWVQMVLEGQGAGSPEDERIRMLAAGVLIRAKEIVDRYQRLLMGELVNYM